jgi:hypothetical protein
MTSVRLVAFALLISPLFVFAQDQHVSAQSNPLVLPKHAEVPLQRPSESLRPVPDQPQQANAAQRLQNNAQLEAEARLQLPLVDANLDRGVFIPPYGDSWGDGICYKIRSYVVARDNKNSDSVHPVRYSTCQMGSKYHLKTTQAPPVSPER